MRVKEQQKMNFTAGFLTLDGLSRLLLYLSSQKTVFFSFSHASDSQIFQIYLLWQPQIPIPIPLFNFSSLFPVNRQRVTSSIFFLKKEKKKMCNEWFY